MGMGLEGDVITPLFVLTHASLLSSYVKSTYRRMPQSFDVSVADQGRSSRRRSCGRPFGVTCPLSEPRRWLLLLPNTFLDPRSKRQKWITTQSVTAASPMLTQAGTTIR